MGLKGKNITILNPFLQEGFLTHNHLLLITKHKEHYILFLIERVDMEG